jgi:hypothetical protein
MCKALGLVPSSAKNKAKAKLVIRKMLFKKQSKHQWLAQNVQVTFLWGV